MAIGVPGCPELAAWTASMDSVRIVLIQIMSISRLSCMTSPNFCERMDTSMGHVVYVCASIKVFRNRNTAAVNKTAPMPATHANSGQTTLRSAPRNKIAGAKITK